MNMRDNADVRRLLRDLHDRLSGIGPECAEVPRPVLAIPSPETGGAPTCLKFQPHPGGERCHVCGGVGGDHPATPAPEPVKPPVTCIIGRYCGRHDFVHGGGG